MYQFTDKRVAIRERGEESPEGAYFSAMGAHQAAEVPVSADRAAGGFKEKAASARSTEELALASAPDAGAGEDEVEKPSLGVSEEHIGTW